MLEKVLAPNSISPLPRPLLSQETRLDDLISTLETGEFMTQLNNTRKRCMGRSGAVLGASGNKRDFLSPQLATTAHLAASAARGTAVPSRLEVEEGD